MGAGIIETLHRMLSLESRNWSHASTYTVGTGNLAADYVWIQNLTMFKYELYALVLAVIIVCDLYFIGFYAFTTNNINMLKEPKLIMKYFMLLLGVIFSTITLGNLILGGSDTQNIISRTLNYSLLFVSIFIASSFNSLNIPSKPLRRTIKGFFIVFLLIAFATYPFYSYGRDSYINYPTSQEVGSNFFRDHAPDDNLNAVSSYTKAAYFYQMMEGRDEEEDNVRRSTVYVNGWYSMNYQTEVSHDVSNEMTSSFG